MTYLHIQDLHVRNYGCIQDAKFTLGRLHALIGPNDSGKSTILRALRTVTQFAVGSFTYDTSGVAHPFEHRIDEKATGTQLQIGYADGIGYRLQTTERSPQDRRPGLQESVLIAGQPISQGTADRDRDTAGMLRNRTFPEATQLRSRITNASLVRFDPDALREPSLLIPDGDDIAFADERGRGLAAVFDRIFNDDGAALAKIEAEVRTLFPSIERLRLLNRTDSRKEIAASLIGGKRLLPSELSEGLLYFLGFAALRYMGASRLLLIEEPENGLHPSRIAEVMTILRKISETSQVVIATHSPLVVNELSGDEVTVVTRDPQTGTQSTLLKDVPHYEQAMEVYQPGEFWLSYADGATEAPLLQGKPRL